MRLGSAATRTADSTPTSSLRTLAKARRFCLFRRRKRYLRRWPGGRCFLCPEGESETHRRVVRRNSSVTLRLRNRKVFFGLARSRGIAFGFLIEGPSDRIALPCGGLKLSLDLLGSGFQPHPLLDSHVPVANVFDSREPVFGKAAGLLSITQTETCSSGEALW